MSLKTPMIVLRSLILPSCIAVALLVLASCVPSRETASSVTAFSFQVAIISGSRAGQMGTGALVLPSQALRTPGETQVPVHSFEFHYADRTFFAKDCDGVPMVRLVDGVPQEIIVTGGPRELRFGFSAGFERHQFGRASEHFILKGQPYFGYLDPRTYVDGAGKVSFAKP